MNLKCTACDESLAVSADQLGQSIRCPSCHVVMEVHRSGAVSNAMVSCPGCHHKLVIPRSGEAKAKAQTKTFRCPKCHQFLVPGPDEAESDAERGWERGQTDGGGRWREFDSPISPPPPGGIDDPTTLARRKRYRLPSSNRPTDYSEKIPSVAPGVILLIAAVLSLLGEAARFFYAMGITDPELLADEEVRRLKMMMMLSASMAGIYFGAIVWGAIQMIVRQRIWAGRIACILAVLPIPIFAFGIFWVGVVVYLVLASAAVWGLIVLFGRNAP